MRMMTVGLLAALNRLGRAAALGLLAGSLGGCALVGSLPDPTTTDQRLAMLPTAGLPLDAPVTVRWDRRMIPFIEAETDGDAAFTLGLVQAHLRLGQMAALRRLTQGRLAESAGPLATKIDFAFRTFDFGRAADDIYAAMPPDSRLWIDRFAAGINHYAASLPPDGWPHEFQVLDMAWEPWTPQDSLTIGRAGAADFNWRMMVSLLEVGDPALQERVLARVLRLRDGAAMVDRGPASETPVPEREAGRPDLGRTAALRQLAQLERFAYKGGSNSIAIAPERSTTGGALIASDPHLGFQLPNLWLIAGIRSPSYEMVGMMAAGTPVFGFGRNRHLAWGGTNLRATTSMVVDVSGLPADRFRTVEHDIGVRFWFDETAGARVSPYGPVLGDFNIVEQEAGDLAIRWVGHDRSDEISALLGAMKARRFAEFRAAMAGFAVPSQTFLVADSSGTIAGMMATKVPAKPAGTPLRLTYDPAAADAYWQRFYTTADFPPIVDPDAGFLVSANNPLVGETDKPFGGFFPQDERVRRLTELVSAAQKLSPQDLQRIQLDSVSLLSREVVASLAPRLRQWPDDAPGRPAADLMLAWDGDYAVQSRGAAVFETFLTQFIPAVYDALGRSAEVQIYQDLRLGRTFLIEDMAALDAAGWQAALGPALAEAGAVAEAGTVWGDLHRLDVQHVLGQVPVVGGRYRLQTLPVAGSRETILKTAHDLTAEEHRARFGAQSRHVSDLSDPDANWFVILGGQDGWLNSPNFNDQTALWQNGEMAKVPLTPAAVAAGFPTVSQLTPR